MAKLKPKPASDLIEAVLSVAEREIGTPERLAYRYRRTLGAPPRSPWCVSFVAFCLAGGVHQYPFAIPSYCSGDLKRRAIRAGLVYPEPQRGDIFMHTSNELRRRGRCWHVGFVKTLLEDGRWTSIEGNGLIPLGEQNMVKQERYSTSYFDTLFLRWVEAPVYQETEGIPAFLRGNYVEVAA